MSEKTFLLIIRETRFSLLTRKLLKISKIGFHGGVWNNMQKIPVILDLDYIVKKKYYGFRTAAEMAKKNGNICELFTKIL